MNQTASIFKNNFLKFKIEELNDKYKLLHQNSLIQITRLLSIVFSVAIQLNAVSTFFNKNYSSDLHP